MNINTDTRPDTQEDRGGIKPAKGLGKAAWKKLVDLALYLIACTLTGTGLLLAYRLPRGRGNADPIIFLGYDRHEWGNVHTWLAYLAVLLAAIHLLLNWQWLVKVASAKHLWRLAGILTGLFIVGVFLFFPAEGFG